MLIHVARRQRAYDDENVLYDLWHGKYVIFNSFYATLPIAVLVSMSPYRVHTSPAIHTPLFLKSSGIGWLCRRRC